MSRFSYTSLLDQDVVKSSELDTLFAQLGAWYNAPSLEEDNVEPNVVEYRHTNRPLSLELMRQFSKLTGNITFGGAFGGYYPILESVLTLDLGAVTSYNNRNEGNMPVGLVTAKVHCSAGFAPNASTIANFIIGVSTDAGTTWTSIPATRRPVGLINGGSHCILDGPQPNYMTGVTGYIPKNYAMDKHIILIASLGGRYKDADSNGPRMFCVMADSNVMGRGYIKGEIEANIRWTLDTP